MIPKPQRNVAQKIVDDYRATTLTDTQKKLKEMEEENQKLRNDNEKLRTMLIKGTYCTYFIVVVNHAINHYMVWGFTFFFFSLCFRLLNYC